MKKIVVALTTIVLLLTSSFVRCEEKVIFLEGGDIPTRNQLDQDLLNGWKVKHVAGSGTCSDYFFVFILERNTTANVSNNSSIDRYKIAISDSF